MTSRRLTARPGGQHGHHGNHRHRRFPGPGAHWRSAAPTDDELTRLSGPPPLLDRLLKPLNRLGTQRFLREARAKVRANAIALNRARGQGPGVYAARLAELEKLSAAKVTALQAPGQVLLKLAATGFGVRLPG